jgi:hypothetical protein
MSTATESDTVKLKVIRGSVDSVSLFEVTDYELSVLESGGPSSTYLNFAIFFFSISVSFGTTLLTVSGLSVYLYSSFLIATLGGASISAVLVVLWLRTKSSVKNVCKKIRGRVPA